MTSYALVIFNHKDKEIKQQTIQSMQPICTDNFGNKQSRKSVVIHYEEVSY